MAQNKYDVLVNLQANANDYEKEIANLKTQYSQISSTGAVEETQKVWENLKKARKMRNRSLILHRCQISCSCCCSSSWLLLQ